MEKENKPIEINAEDFNLPDIERFANKAYYDYEILDSPSTSQSALPDYIIWYWRKL